MQRFVRRKEALAKNIEQIEYHDLQGKPCPAQDDYDWLRVAPYVYV